ncbi:MAG: hypothetical protein ACI9MR_000355 [Myxococcota bacterium]|jgi:hypothetical protein
MRLSLPLCYILVLALTPLGACGDSSDPVADTVADADTADTADCEYARDDAGHIVSCMGATPQAPEAPCPTGFQCSGLSAFWCYRGSACNLPICLPDDARIATPSGETAVTELQVGQLVWTRTASGERVAAPIVVLGHTLAPTDHAMLRVTLEDGRTTRASPRHPGPDGRPLMALSAGETFAGDRVTALAFEPYDGALTYDLLPAGETGQYWVDGVLMGSTLRHNAR